MENIENQIRNEYEWQFCKKAQPLIQWRRSNLSQSEMAHKIGVSLKSIQRFERLKLIDYYYIFAYKSLSNE